MAETFSTLLGAQAEPRAVAFRGKIYRARPWTQHVKTAWERWLASRTQRTALAGCETAEERKAIVELIMERSERGVYAFHGELSQRVMKTDDGVISMVAITFECNEDEAIALMAGCPEALPVFQLTMQESFPAVTAQKSTTSHPLPGQPGDSAPNPAAPAGQ